MSCYSFLTALHRGRKRISLISFLFHFFPCFISLYISLFIYSIIFRVRCSCVCRCIARNQEFFSIYSLFASSVSIEKIRNCWLYPIESIQSSNAGDCSGCLGMPCYRNRNDINVCQAKLGWTKPFVDRLIGIK